MRTPVSRCMTERQNDQPEKQVQGSAQGEDITKEDVAEATVEGLEEEETPETNR